MSPRFEKGALSLGIGLVLAAGTLAVYGVAHPQEHVTAAPAPVTEATPSASFASPSPTAVEIIPSTQFEGLANPATKRRAEKVISTFENSTTKIQYDYAENLDDGRGITAGRAGFCSGTGDLLEVVQRYTQLKPGNELAKYLPALEADNNSDSTKGLSGFEKAWKHASDNDPALNQAQDEVYDELYFNPAMARAEAAGIHTAVGQLIVLDIIIQHGEGDDPDGLPAIMQEAIAAMGGPANGNEQAWLQKLLQIRRHHLLNPADPSTQQDWAESVDRVTALESILATGNFDLKPPLSWSVYGDSFKVTS